MRPTDVGRAPEASFVAGPRGCPQPLLFGWAVVGAVMLAIVGLAQTNARGHESDGWETIQRVSAPPEGGSADGDSRRPAISADGRLVAFDSSAPDLVAGDSNGESDVFVGDPSSRTVVRVSVADDGTQANDFSIDPAISADGNTVAFHSAASNLVAGDKNDVDVFVRDLLERRTIRVSVASDGTEANGSSSRPALSADGRVIAFDSTASNLVNGDTNATTDVFVHDRRTGETTRVSVASDGTQADHISYGAALSVDGRFVAFQSGATNLVSDDTNGTADVFVHDRQTGETTAASVASDGSPANGFSFGPALSADGRFISFESVASDLVAGDTNGVEDVFVRDLAAGATYRVSVASDGAEGDGGSLLSSLSADGRLVAFQSAATNLVAGDTNHAQDIFVHDRETGVTRRASVDDTGAEADAPSFEPALSGDGLRLVFASLAANLAGVDDNRRFDVYLAVSITAAPPEGGDPTPPPSEPQCTLTGTDGDDFLVGTPGIDVICGLAGDDRLDSFAGDDVLLGDDGNDRLFGHDGNDRLEGGPGDDRLQGGYGDDTLDGGSGRDHCNGGGGGDVVIGCETFPDASQGQAAAGDRATRCPSCRAYRRQSGSAAPDPPSGSHPHAARQEHQQLIVRSRPSPAGWPRRDRHVGDQRGQTSIGRPMSPSRIARSAS